MSEPAESEATRYPQPATDPQLTGLSIGAFDHLYLSGCIDPPRQMGSIGSLGEFIIIRQIGIGGMGIVFEARETVSGARRAIKVLRPELSASPQATHRFLVEAEHMHRLSHEHILAVEKVVDRPQGPYYVMAFAEGGSLLSRLRADVPLDLQTTLRVSRDIASALVHAHSKGIIHRDIKPANVLVDDNGAFLLCDFGLVRTVFNDSLTDVSQTQREGTAAYMSPGVAAGAAEDTRCDIYSFGALLYEMLAGKPPYEGRSVEAILQQVIAGPPQLLSRQNPSAPRGLVAIAEGCLARALRDRYAQMADVLVDLERLGHGRPPLGPHARAQGPRVRGIHIAAAMLVVVGSAAVYTAFPGAHHEIGTRIGGIPTTTPSIPKSTVPSALTGPAATAISPATTEPGRKPVVSAITARFRLLSRDVQELQVDDDQLSDDDLAAIEGLTSLRVLVLKGPHMTDAGLSHLRGLKELRRVNLQSASLSGSGLECLLGMKHLHSLYLGQCPITDEGLSFVAQLPQLRYLYLQNTKVSSAGLFRLTALSQLDTLDISFCKLEDADLEFLRGLTRITTLGLSGVHDLTDHCLQNLQNASKLSQLELRFTSITGEGLPYLAHSTQLHSLNLSDSLFSDEGAEHLPILPALRRLNVSHTSITDKGLEHIGKCTNLSELTLSRTRITGQGLQHLSHLVHLSSLDLSRTSTSDSDLHHLSMLLELTELSLSENRVSGAGLKHLESLTKLQVLHLCATGLSDEDLQALAAVPSLATLDVSSTRVTDRGVSMLQKTMPAIKIQR